MLTFLIGSLVLVLCFILNSLSHLRLSRSFSIFKELKTEILKLCLFVKKLDYRDRRLYPPALLGPHYSYFDILFFVQNTCYSVIGINKVLRWLPCCSILNSTWLLAIQPRLPLLNFQSALFRSPLISIIWSLLNPYVVPLNLQGSKW